MALNPQKGNMYPWVTHTWNPFGGECPHQCTYCFVDDYKVPHLKEKYSGEIRLDEKLLKDNLGNGNTIFVCSSFDMFADKVPREWIVKVLTRCRQFDNQYLFQSKNAWRFDSFYKYFPEKILLGTTIESNRDLNVSKARKPYDRYLAISNCRKGGYKTMISIEPILDFDLDVMVRWIRDIKPEFVSIGADSKGHNLPEPSEEKVDALIKELSKFTEVKVKDNLKRLLG